MNFDWHNCYSEGWQNEIVPEAFSHPAKFSRALIRRIYAHALEQGYLKPGDWVADCFAGVGLGAADALALGLNWFGNELEQNFVDLGGGCDCTGISKDDWVACFGRWTRFAHEDGWHWCPRCLAEAEGVIEPRPPSLPGMEPEPTASYQRNSGKIPHTEPHRYTGNLDLFAKHAKNGARAMLVQGDSRRLVEVLEGARAEGLISSPPYACSFTGEQENPEVTRERMRRKGHSEQSIAKVGDFGHSGSLGYGTDPAQLGNMPTGEPPQAVISSPPLGKAQSGGTSFWEGLEERHGREFSDKVREGSQGYREDQLGNSDGQLAAMREGDVDAVIASPPFTDSQQARRADFVLDSTKVNPTPRKLGDRLYFPAEMESEGQLTQMKEGDVDAVIASPPWTGDTSSHCGPSANQAIAETAKRLGKSMADVTPIEAKREAPRKQSYGENDGQLAALPEGEPPVGIVSSPPWESTEGSHSAAKFRDPEGSAERRAEGYRTGKLKGHGASKEAILRAMQKEDQSTYGDDPSNLGNQQGDTFWSAAKTILLQCHAVLAPGGVAIWVLKDFIRAKKRVDFTGQWRMLCESCGFETIEVIRAWLIEERGAQFALNGDLVKKEVKHASFFRRLHEKKYPHLAINWEVVLITRKGAA